MPALGAFAALLGLAAPAQGAPMFTDVTEEAGLAELINPNPEGASAHGGGVAMLDYDQDGLFDLLFVRKDLPSVLLHNDGDWVFRDATSEAGLDTTGRPFIGVAVQDIDADGWPDLVMLGNDGAALWVNQGDGTYAPISDTGLDRPGWPIHSAAFGDIDGDGDLDLYAGNHARDLAVFEHSPVNQELLDEDDCTGNSLYLQDEAFHWLDFGRQSGVANDGCTLAVAMTDLDADGWLDLYVTNDHGAYVKPDALYWNNGLGAEGGLAPLTRDAEVQPAIEGMGIGIADHDRDGDLDFFLSNTTANVFFVTHGGRTFAESSRLLGIEPTFEPKLAWGVGFEDFDLDGWADLWAVNTQSHNSFYRNQGDGTFVHELDAIPEEPDTVAVQFGLAFGDLDNDGDLDVVTGGLGGESPVGEEDRRGHALFLYRNDQSSGHHWLQVALEARSHHPSAVGARIEVVTADGTQLSEVSGGTSYGSSPWPLETFGLGTATRIERLTVTWPGGTSEVLHDLAVDRRITLVEGEVVDTGERVDSADTGTADSGEPTTGRCDCSSATGGGAGWLWAGLLLGWRRRDRAESQGGLSRRTPPRWVVR